MARIEGVSDRDAGWFARIVYAFSRKKLKRVVGPLRVAAHQPWILAAMGGFEMGLERARRVEERLKALGEIRAATLVGCPF